MKKIILIACVSKKGDKKAKAKDLYKSTLFKSSLAYAYKLNPDKIFILSALHHLLDLDKEIEPYNVTLSNVPKEKRKPELKILNLAEKKEWGKQVIEQLSKQTDLENDTFIILAGQEYIKPIHESIPNLVKPLDGLRQGERLKFFNEHPLMRNIVLELHELFNKQKRYNFPFEQFKSQIPQNGIYIVFEKGEKFKDFDRIVRVGTHTGNNQLHSRLNQHFINENKNRSIFRKNIGRCILKIDNSNYMNLWELDTTSIADKERNSQLLDKAFEQTMEKRISSYVQTNLSFCVFRLDTKDERLFWESKIASTLAQSNELIPSSNWLGNNSPKEKIRESGLWQVNELSNPILTEDEFEKLKEIVTF